MPEFIRKKISTLVLPEVYINDIPPLNTTPSVLNCLVHKFTNTGAVTVTNFIDGASGQTIRVKGDGNTTIQNNTTIKTNTAADKLTAAYKMYVLTLIDGVWYEDA